MSEGVFGDDLAVLVAIRCGKRHKRQIEQVTQIGERRVQAALRRLRQEATIEWTDGGWFTTTL